jgi:phosphate transport system substrate-binding protein
MNINKTIAAAALAATFVLTACGGGGATPTPGGSTTPTPSGGVTAPPSGDDPTDVAGSVDIHGSSTVAPISNAVAEDISLANDSFSYVVGDEGTGAGFANFFCVDGSDIQDASRKIRADDPAKEGDEEATICANNGVEYVELKVGFDGIAVITSINNPIECLSFADLYALFGPESDNVNNWNDAEALAHQLGSTTDLPDAPLSITAPGDESGTYDSFIEIALNSFIAAQFPNDPATAANETADATHLRTPGGTYVASANDNAIIQGVAGFDTSLGFVGLAYAEESADQVKMIGIDKAGDGTCITPSTETVQDGSYPLSRSLYIYPNLGRIADNGTIAQYVDYYLSDAGIANVTEVGYVALHADELQATRDAWAAAKP